MNQLYEATCAAEDAHGRVQQAAMAQTMYVAIPPIVLPPLPSFVAHIQMDVGGEGGGGATDASADGGEEERLCVYVSKEHPIRGTIGRSLVVTSAAITSYDLNAAQPKKSRGAAVEAAALDDGEGAIAEGRQTNTWPIDRLCCVRSTFCDNICMVAFQVIRSGSTPRGFFHCVPHRANVHSRHHTTLSLPTRICLPSHPSSTAAQFLAEGVAHAVGDGGGGAAGSADGTVTVRFQTFSIHDKVALCSRLERELRRRRA